MGDSLIVLFVVYIFNHRKLSYLFKKNGLCVYGGSPSDC